MYLFTPYGVPARMLSCWKSSDHENTRYTICSSWTRQQRTFSKSAVWAWDCLVSAVQSCSTNYLTTEKVYWNIARVYMERLTRDLSYPGSDTIAGGQGTMWTTALQIGELVETAQEVTEKKMRINVSVLVTNGFQVYDPTETRVLVTHASPGREGLLAQLALVLRVRWSVESGEHIDRSALMSCSWLTGRFYDFRWPAFPIRYFLQRILLSTRPGALPQPIVTISAKLYAAMGSYQGSSRKLRRVSYCVEKWIHE